MLNQKKIEDELTRGFAFKKKRQGNMFAVMLDCTNGEVWCDYFINLEESTNYQGKSIINIGKKILLAGEEITLESVVRHSQYMIKYYRYNERKKKKHVGSSELQ